MSTYYSLGRIPQKRHIQFPNTQGGLYSEELFGTMGFSGKYSNVYHIHPPTQVKSVGAPIDIAPEIAIQKNLQNLSFQGFEVPAQDDYLNSRQPMLVNNDLQVAIAAPRQSMDYFYKNVEADELLFIHQGSGTLKTMFGCLPFSYGDYVVIPKGMIYQLEFDSEDNRLLIVESFSAITTPKRYRNEYGQLLEHSPFCERDIKRPVSLETYDEVGDFDIRIKKHGAIYPYVYANHPFDVVGWDGFHYPYAFSIHDFEPITGRIHMPPPIHQTFEGHNFVICSFVPRLYDYHPEAIPAPYNHSNIDSDEVLYYVDGDFMSRNNIHKGQLTLHPGGLVHGPHPGAVERSIGKKETGELAVMIDPFNPLMVTKAAMEIEVAGYYKSWMPTGEPTI